MKHFRSAREALHQCAWRGESRQWRRGPCLRTADNRRVVAHRRFQFFEHPVGIGSVRKAVFVPSGHCHAPQVASVPNVHIKVCVADHTLILTQCLHAELRRELARVIWHTKIKRQNSQSNQNQPRHSPRTGGVWRVVGKGRRTDRNTNDVPPARNETRVDVLDSLAQHRRIPQISFCGIR